MAKDNEFTIEMLKRTIANPFYCLPEVHSAFMQKHEPLVSEEMWIKAGARAIEETGAEEFLKDLLENLKGNFLGAEDGVVDGYKSVIKGDE